MSTNTAALKTFAQQTRAKLISLITTKMQFVLNGDTAELRGYEREIGELRKQIREKTEKIVIEEVAYTWFNRVMALRFMDANGYNAPKIVTPATGQTRPEILQDAMSGSIDDELMLTAEEKLLPEAKLYRKLLVAVCNKKMSSPMPFLFEHISDYTELLLPDDLLSDSAYDFHLSGHHGRADFVHQQDKDRQGDACLCGRQGCCPADGHQCRHDDLDHLCDRFRSGCHCSGLAVLHLSILVTDAWLNARHQGLYGCRLRWHRFDSRCLIGRSFAGHDRKSDQSVHINAVIGCDRIYRIDRRLIN